MEDRANYINLLKNSLDHLLEHVSSYEMIVHVFVKLIKLNMQGMLCLLRHCHHMLSNLGCVDTYCTVYCLLFSYHNNTNLTGSCRNLNAPLKEKRKKNIGKHGNLKNDSFL